MHNAKYAIVILKSTAFSRHYYTFFWATYLFFVTFNPAAFCSGLIELSFQV